MLLHGSHSLASRPLKKVKGVIFVLVVLAGMADRARATAELTEATSAPGAKAASPASTGATEQKSVVQRYPLTILVINRETRETYAYPSAGVTAFQSDAVTLESAATFGPYSKVLPVPDLPKVLATKAEINSLSLPLAKRAAIYAQSVIRGLAPLNLTGSTPWTLAVLKVMGRARAFFGAQDTAAANAGPAWPPTIPLSMTQLNRPESILGSGAFERALLAVIECRSDSAAGAVEQIDFVAFGGPQMTRTFWSRDTHDPTYFKRADEAISQVAEKFRQRLARSQALAGSRNEPNAELGDTKVMLEVSRLVSETLIADVQRVLKGMAPQVDSVLVPVGVDRDFVRYTTPVAAADLQKFKEALVALPRQQDRFAITTRTESAKEGSAANTVTQRLQVTVLQLVPPPARPSRR